MTQWKWVNRKVLLLLHDESLAEHGGAAGLRSEGLLDSALARPVHLALYENPDFARLAASYGVALAKNHAFVDGNKRAAFLSMGLFLGANGYRLTISQLNTTLVVMEVAAGTMDEEALADWIRTHSKAR